MRRCLDGGCPMSISRLGRLSADQTTCRPRRTAQAPFRAMTSIPSAKTATTLTFRRGQMITGDRIEIYTADQTTLDLSGLSGMERPPTTLWLWFCHVDHTGRHSPLRRFQRMHVRWLRQSARTITPAVFQTFWCEPVTNFSLPSPFVVDGLSPQAVRKSIQQFLARIRFAIRAQPRLRTGLNHLHLGLQVIECNPEDCDYQLKSNHYLCKLLLRLKQGAKFRGQLHHPSFTVSPSVWYESLTSILLTLL